MSKEDLQPILNATYPIDWTKINKDDLDEALEVALKLAQERISALEETPIDQVNFENFVMGFEYADDELGNVWGICNHLNNVADDQKIRDIVKKWTPIVSEFSSKAGQSKPLYERMKAIAESSEFEGLNDLQKRYVTEGIQDFVLGGVALDDSKKKEYIEIEKELEELKNEFGENVLDQTNDYELFLPEGAEENDLKGMPKAQLEMARKSAQEAGKNGYRFTLHAPSFVALMTYSPNRELRKKMWEVGNDECTKGKYNNLPNIPKILELRQRKAKLLGYDNYVELTTERRMLKGTKKIQGFIDELYEKSRSIAEQDFKELQDFKASLAEETGDHEPLDRWDFHYYKEKLMQSKLGLSTEATRPFFEFNTSINSLFGLCEKIYNVRFEKAKEPKAWHSSVDYYEMFDKESGRRMGGFYTDFFPRKEKRAGAWMDNIVIGSPNKDGILSEHVGFIGGNFIPPTDETPALLSHNELTTLFHEFGHLMHLMMTNVQIPSMAGTNVTWDFVELPSQLMENYCFDTDFLKGFAKHYETGEVISDEMIQKLQDSQTFMAGYMCNRQLSLGTLDIYLHSTEASEFTEDNLFSKLKGGPLKKFEFSFPTPASPILTTFTHLFDGGYGAGYYSYKWSEILEADVWEQFLETGITNPETGKAWCDGILSRGDSADAMDLFVGYRGREPSMDPYVRRLQGIEGPQNSSMGSI